MAKKIAKTKRVRLKAVKTAEGNFSIDLAVNGQKFSASAPTISEAILLLPSFNPKTKGTIVISKKDANGELKASKPIVLAIPNLNRLFYPGMTGEVNRTVLEKRYKFFT